ncbi:hypothetical protein [Planococcus sp. CAU13]|uniref:hypothetical protein n=1 Tax=Planococcus sp. CAU13 TaxID=1541197 RepID=UPI00052FEF5D|nr:hypothetical protein [Planococcus sp. CAU13]
MDDLLGYAVAALFAIGFFYTFIKQVKQTVIIRNENKVKDYKRLLVGNYITSIALGGFLLSYLVNLFIGIQLIAPNIIASGDAVLSCFIFLVVLVVGRFVIISEENNQKKELV